MRTILFSLSLMLVACDGAEGDPPAGDACTVDITGAEVVTAALTATASGTYLVCSGGSLTTNEANNVIVLDGGAATTNGGGDDTYLVSGSLTANGGGGTIYDGGGTYVNNGSNITIEECTSVVYEGATCP